MGVQGMGTRDEDGGTAAGQIPEGYLDSGGKMWEES